MDKIEQNIIYRGGSFYANSFYGNLICHAYEKLISKVSAKKNRLNPVLLCYGERIDFASVKENCTELVSSRRDAKFVDSTCILSDNRKRGRDKSGEIFESLNRQNGRNPILTQLHVIFLVSALVPGNLSFINVNNLSVPINSTLISYYRNGEGSFKICKNESVTFCRVDINFREIHEMHFNINSNTNSAYKVVYASYITRIFKAFKTFVNISRIFSTR